MISKGQMPILMFSNSPGLFLLLLIGGTLARATATAQVSSTFERSPQGISLIQHVVDASGGVSSIIAVRDLTATGTITPSTTSKNASEESVTISIRGLNQLRFDSQGATGARSNYYNRGRLSRKEADGSVVPVGFQDELYSIGHFFPLGHLCAALSDSSYSVSQPETVTENRGGRQLYHIRVRQAYSGTVKSVNRLILSNILDYYIDPNTYALVSVQNHHRDRGVTVSLNGPLDIYQFGAYSEDHGLLLPHQITISLDSRLISTIRISSYQLNVGLAENYFAPSQK